MLEEYINDNADNRAYAAKDNQNSIFHSLSKCVNNFFLKMFYVLKTNKKTKIFKLCL